ncbi:hypothetical protein BGZ95_003343 [Linnemannia exigua]|uniref:Mitochondrial K+-H+ exchange-related-domain-containing protein n=1 Tax=Linnemannia exigua TaxID=604196 RepID=A0AAD4DK78_9FUNG|nr:hypothetical protein BGZ95_003343 [Linnemannia exigua]
MRIFLIPLSRRAHALHCHSTLAKPSASYLNRVIVFASKKWEELSRAEPDSVKRKLYSAGTTMLEKIEHRETFFKEVPAKEDITITTMVPFMYPSSLKEAKVQAEFKTLVEQRIPYHRKYMIYSAMWVPVTSLFTIVPLVPNIPFFYNAYRLWSHWKAYNGAKHLNALIKNGSITFHPSEVLDLGLQHDPTFAVYFTGSYQLSKRRRAFKKPIEQDPNSPVIAESSGELSQDKDALMYEKRATVLDVQADTTTVSGEGVKAPRSSTILPKKHDPLSVTDHVAYEGFLSDAEIEKISWAFEEAPNLKRELKRARYQEAAKYVKENMMKGGPSKHT